MNTTQKDNYISPDEYEVLQSKYDCKTEYADGEIWVSSSTASRDRVFKFNIYREYGLLDYNVVEQEGTVFQYTLKDGQYNAKAYSIDDEYLSSVFTDLKINLKDIF
ncbi:MAG TPA: hypothetical protein DGK91_08045 [Clostridium sp.]|nr:hypothetical protein [Clostridium sp.]